MASSRIWVGTFIAVAMAGLAGCANPTNVPDGAKLIYSGAPIKFVTLEGPPSHGSLFVYDDDRGKVVRMIAIEPQCEYEVVNAADGHDVHVYWSESSSTGK